MFFLRRCIFSRLPSAIPVFPPDVARSRLWPSFFHGGYDSKTGCFLLPHIHFSETAPFLPCMVHQKDLRKPIFEILAFFPSLSFHPSPFLLFSSLSMAYSWPDSPPTPRSSSVMSSSQQTGGKLPPFFCFYPVNFSSPCSALLRLCGGSF